MLCSIEPGSAVAAEIWDAYRELGESVRNKGVIASLASRERELNAELSVLRSQAREAAREASEAAREASEAAREASEAAMEAYVTRWERDRLAARIAENTPSDEGATLIRAARAIASFLRDHPRTAQALRRAAGFVDGRRSKASIAHDYRAWIKHFDSVSANSFEANEVLRGINIRRRLSIVMPVCDPVPEFLAAAIGSVERQIYPDWELVVVDDGSVDSPVRDALESLHHRDERIRVIHRERRGGISAALNTGLDNASGEFVAFLDHDDVLATDALLIVALLLDERPDVSLVYSDEDALDEAGSRTAPYFKPDWNPSLLLGQNFACHFLVCRKNLVQSIGGFRSDFDGAQDWDLALRIAEAVEDEHIAHLPHVLYHWRRHAGSTAAGVAAKPYVVDAGRRAVEEALQRRNVPASPVSLSNGWNRLVYELPAEAPDVDVVVPTALAHPFVGLCLKRVLDQTHYPALAIKLVVSETSLSERGSRLPKSIRDDPRVTVVPYEGDSFNYSRAVNLGAASGKAELLCLLNDDVIATESGWLTALAARAIQPGVGATGALLRFPDETIQHGGVILGLGDAALAYHEGVPVGQPGYCGRALLDQDLSCVTAACMVVRRQVFDQLAGFDESFEVSFNDVDFCLRLRAAGWRIVWTPEARLYHTESTSVRQIPGRVSQYQDESRRMWERWASVLSSDPFYSPNLSLAAPNALAWPPRVIRPTLAPG
jgi:GT2 family glycosyltransferase